jgi:putative DNA primase/helicase
MPPDRGSRDDWPQYTRRSPWNGCPLTAGMTAMTMQARRPRRPKPRDLLDCSDIVSPQSEKACLAGLVELLQRDTPAYDEIAGQLEPAMFMADFTGDLFAALQATRVINPSPSLADIVATMRRDAQNQGIDAKGDPARTLLVELAAETAHMGTLAMRSTLEAAAEVRETFARRRTIAACGDAIRRMHEPLISVDEIRAIAGRLQAVGEIVDGTCHGASELVLTPASEIPAKPIKWLWPQRISLGALTIVTGQVGISKSTLTLDIASRVSTGSKWPDGAGSSPKGDVILVGSEDDPGKVVIPRLIAAGADTARVHICRGVRHRDVEYLDALMIERDLELVRRKLEQLPDVRMIVFDPLSENILADENSNAQIRAALQPLVNLAQEREVAIVAVLHQSKKTDLSLIQRIAGASSYTQQARHILAVLNDPEDDTVGMERRRLFVVQKNSYGEEFVGQKYRVTTRSSDQPAIEWLPGTVQIDADRIATKPTGGAHHAEAQSQAVDAMRDVLAAGERPASEVHAEMEAKGFSRRQIDHAASRLGIIKQQEGRRWMWRLPAAEQAAASGFYSFEDWPPR